MRQLSPTSLFYNGPCEGEVRLRFGDKRGRLLCFDAMNDTTVRSKPQLGDKPIRSQTCNARAKGLIDYKPKSSDGGSAIQQRNGPTFVARSEANRGFIRNNAQIIDNKN